MKPMLATDWDQCKVNFPVMVQPKIDGVRGLNFNGKLTGRSLRQHANRFVSTMFSRPDFIGLDGEMAAEHECHLALCRRTTSALNSINGEPFIVWWLFDRIVDNEGNLLSATPYKHRYLLLADWIHLFNEQHAGWNHRLRLIPQYEAHNFSQLQELDTKFLDEGYEGTIIRDPYGTYKQGRSTVREGGLLRIKRFADAEAVVVRIEEGRRNDNESVVNELGQTERSTHQENMVPNAMVGALICKDCKSGDSIKVAAGCMTHSERTMYFRRPELLIGKTIKYKKFERGVKDKPRFPTFQGIRADSDIS